MKFALLASLMALAAAAPPAAMHVAQRVPLHDGGWDILTVDPVSHRVLISRSDGVDAVDTRTGGCCAVYPDDFEASLPGEESCQQM